MASFQQRFVRDEQGSTVVEYALLLAVIGGAILVGIDAVGAANDGTFEAVARGFEQTDRSTNRESTAIVASSVATKPTTTVADRLTTIDPHPPWQLPVAIGLLTVGTLLWYLVYRRRKKLDAADESNEAPIEISAELAHDRKFRKRQRLLAMLENEGLTAVEGRLDVRHLMSDRITFVATTTPIEEVRELMQSKGIHHLPVCKNTSQLVGVISDRDLATKTGLVAGDVMTTNPFSVSPDTLISPAITQMIAKAISCLPVVKDDRLIGVLTTTDLMLVLQCMIQLQQKRMVEMRLENTEPELVDA
jgi:CBS domain-containing protein